MYTRPNPTAQTNVTLLQKNIFASSEILCPTRQLPNQMFLTKRMYYLLNNPQQSPLSMITMLNQDNPAINKNALVFYSWPSLHIHKHQFPVVLINSPECTDPGCCSLLVISRVRDARNRPAQWRPCSAAGASYHWETHTPHRNQIIAVLQVGFVLY